MEGSPAPRAEFLLRERRRRRTARGRPQRALRSSLVRQPHRLDRQDEDSAPFQGLGPASTPPRSASPADQLTPIDAGPHLRIAVGSVGGSVVECERCGGQENVASSRLPENAPEAYVTTSTPAWFAGPPRLGHRRDPGPRAIRASWNTGRSARRRSLAKTAPSPGVRSSSTLPSKPWDSRHAQRGMAQELSAPPVSLKLAQGRPLVRSSRRKPGGSSPKSGLGRRLRRARRSRPRRLPRVATPGRRGLESLFDPAQVTSCGGRRGSRCRKQLIDAGAAVASTTGGLSSWKVSLLGTLLVALSSVRRHRRGRGRCPFVRGWLKNAAVDDEKQKRPSARPGRRSGARGCSTRANPGRGPGERLGRRPSRRRSGMHGEHRAGADMSASARRCGLFHREPSRMATQRAILPTTMSCL